MDMYDDWEYDHMDEIDADQDVSRSQESREEFQDKLDAFMNEY